MVRASYQLDHVPRADFGMGGWGFGWDISTVLGGIACCGNQQGLRWWSGRDGANMLKGGGEVHAHDGRAGACM